MPSYEILTTTWQADQQRLSKIRKTVFIEEQSVPKAMEWDEWDTNAWHLLAIDENNEPIGTARILSSGQIGRMAVLVEYRHQGIGSALLKQALRLAKTLQLSKTFIHAQTAVKPFYSRFGFTSVGEEFIEAGIPHVEMHLADKNH